MNHKTNNASPLSRMKDALEKALQSHARQSAERHVIVINQEQLEPIISLIKKGS